MLQSDEQFAKYLDQLEEVVKAGRANLNKCENATNAIVECGTPDGENRLASAYRTLATTERAEIVKRPTKF